MRLETEGNLCFTAHLQPCFQNSPLPHPGVMQILTICDFGSNRLDATRESDGVMGQIDLTCLSKAVAGRMFAVFFCGFLMLTVSVPPAHAQSYSYDEIVVEGNLRVDKESVLRFAGLPPAGQASADELGDAYRRISEAALFESLEIRPEGRRIVIEVVEFPVINEISIEGNKRLNDEQLLPLIRSAPRRIYLPSRAEQDAVAIAEQYRIAGRISTDVTPKIIRRSDNRVDLVFEVIEGGVIETERISFIGNRAFSDNRLRRELSSRQAGILRAFVKSDTFVEERIELDRQKLTEFYTNRGFVDFEILSVSAEMAEKRDAFFLVFTVREGPQYRYGKISASSEVPDLVANDYLGEFRGESGEIFSPAVVLDGLRRMEFLAADRNLRFVFVEPEERRNIENQTIDLNFRIYRGERTFVERIDITGNTTTLDRVIRREFQFAEGDPFNQREIAEAADRIRALGFFSSVVVNSEEGSSPNQAVIKVDVEETPTGSLSFGAAWSQDSGVTGKVSLSERNLLGRGQFLSFSVETGDAATYSLVFIEPRFLDRDVSLRLATSLTTTRGLGQRFSTEQWRLTGSLTFPVSEAGRLTVGTGFSTYRIENVFSRSFIVLSDVVRGPGDRVFVDYSLEFDSRRTGFDPDTGYVLRLGQELGQGTKDKSTILTTTALLGAQTTVLGEGVTLTGELEGGVVTPLTGDSRIRDRFRGNSRIIKGFASNGIGPRDFVLTGTSGELSRTYLDPLGGNYFAALRLESRFPLGLPEEIGVGGGLFLDMGSVWGLDENKCSNYVTGGTNIPSPVGAQPVNQEVKDACVVDDSFKLRASVGFSLFWDTLFGPLRLNFSRPLKSQPYDNAQNFDLTIASIF